MAADSTACGTGRLFVVPETKDLTIVPHVTTIVTGSANPLTQPEIHGNYK
jgi:hypothetical protein